ncbi:hypothetical protein CRUP_025643 [Coryphaenoides rupestris]|nr:hypothetical protein CRUP_025643 [Coryphaenoides rupestris]
MLEIADPIVLALGASRDKSLWKHFRAVSLCLFLLIFPAYMAYMICQFFHMDFWLLIIISSSILTSLQVLGTLLIYILFMVEEIRKAPVENMDEVIYVVNGTYRLLEFLTVFGEWSVMGTTIILVHSYYNVWLRAQLGWQSFLLRRDAVTKIKSLPTASGSQLQQYNDICAICYQDMTNAVITPCSHFFHAGCLKKWLYVQETCPLCHSQLKSQSPAPAGAAPDNPAANQSPPEVGPEDSPANGKEGDEILAEEGGASSSGEGSSSVKQSACLDCPVSASSRPTPTPPASAPTESQTAVTALCSSSSSSSSSSSPLAQRSLARAQRCFLIGRPTTQHHAP